MFAIFEGTPRPHHLIEEGFQKRRHCAVPRREDQKRVLCRHNRVLRFNQGLGHIAALKILLCA